MKQPVLVLDMPEVGSHVWRKTDEGFRLFERDTAPLPLPASKVRPAWLVADAPKAPVVTSFVYSQVGSSDVLDHPVIGGKLTVCVLLYGEYMEMQKKCLESLLSSVPAGRIELRVACNTVPAGTLSYLETLPIDKLYVNTRNIGKYGAMRQMFHDPAVPIQTNYTVWFDDDTQCVNNKWLGLLAQSIIDNHSVAGVWGDRRLAKMRDSGSRQWFLDGSWHHGVNFRNKNGTATPNGDCLHFCQGSWWCVKTSVIAACDLPDGRLRQRGGDMAIGEQLWQNGVNVKQFNSHKSLVWYRPSGKPRGLQEKLPWVTDNGASD